MVVTGPAATTPPADPDPDPVARALKNALAMLALEVMPPLEEGG